MIVQVIGKLAFIAILWAVLAEILTKLVPVPKKILQIEDK
jgi:hypothetical protein